MDCQDRRSGRKAGIRFRRPLYHKKHELVANQKNVEQGVGSEPRLSLPGPHGRARLGMFIEPIRALAYNPSRGPTSLSIIGRRHIPQ
jgi:hypothetical protein